MLLVVAVLAAPLAFLTNRWRREAEARRLAVRSEIRRQLADNHRKRQSSLLYNLERMREEASQPHIFVYSRRPIPPAYYQAQIDHVAEMAAWCEQMAGLLDWAADHPAEPLRPEPPMPLFGMAIDPGGVPPQTQPPSTPVDPRNSGRYAVPRVVKNPR
jgi:hypothetical protein